MRENVLLSNNSARRLLMSKLSAALKCVLLLCYRHQPSFFTAELGLL